MDPALTAALLAAGTGAISAFIGYWWGYGNSQRESRTALLRARAQLHEIRAFNVDLADAYARLKAGDDYTALTPAERAAFRDITSNLRKDAS